MKALNASVGGLWANQAILARGAREDLVRFEFMLLVLAAGLGLSLHALEAELGGSIMQQANGLR